MSNMDHDYEKNRVEYVAQMEAQVQHLRSEYDKYKALADKWEPRVTVANDTMSGQVAFGLEFGGKRANVKVGTKFLEQMDAAGATTQIMEALIKGLVEDQLRAVLLPEVQKAQKGVQAIAGAGKW